jgi:hypothetical protein
MNPCSILACFGTITARFAHAMLERGRPATIASQYAKHLGLERASRAVLDQLGRPAPDG